MTTTHHHILHADPANLDNRTMFRFQLAYLCQYHELTQRDLSQKYQQMFGTPLSQASVSSWMSGKSYPRQTTYQNLCQLFHRDSI